jgi:hypothetical protein
VPARRPNLVKETAMTTLAPSAGHTATDLWYTIVAGALAALTPRRVGRITDADMFDIFSEDDAP